MTSTNDPIGCVPGLPHPGLSCVDPQPMPSQRARLTRTTDPHIPVTPGTKKTCTACGATKALDDFYKVRADKPWRASKCKTCSNAKSRASKRARRTEANRG